MGMLARMHRSTSALLRGARRAAAQNLLTWISPSSIVESQFARKITCCCRSTAWDRQNGHDLHGFAREDREVRMVFEELGGRLVRVGASLFGVGSGFRRYNLKR